MTGKEQGSITVNGEVIRIGDKVGAFQVIDIVDGCAITERIKRVPVKDNPVADMPERMDPSEIPNGGMGWDD